jgi:hypothetical protein
MATLLCGVPPGIVHSISGVVFGVSSSWSRTAAGAGAGAAIGSGAGVTRLTVPSRAVGLRPVRASSARSRARAAM